MLLKTSKAKIFPYASKPLKTVGYFYASLETKNKITAEKIYVVDHEAAGNLLGVHSAKQSNLLKIKQVENTHNINTQANLTTSKINSIANEFSDIFKGR